MDYIRTAKPRIVLLFLASAWAAYMLAGGRLEPRVTLLAIGLAGCVGGAASLNNYLERDVDRLMERTRHRPLPAGRVAPRRILAFGLGLLGIGLALLLVVAGWEPAAWAAAGAAYYLGGYTLLLKPRFAHSAVPGGVAGLFPALVGWSAGSLSSSAEPEELLLLYLLAVVFLWSPPHFWALSLVRRDEYGSAGLPVPSRVSGPDVTRLQMLAYTVGLFGVSLLPGLGGLLGTTYTITALVSGASFTGLVAGAAITRGHQLDHTVFKLSGPYLAVLFAAMVADGGPTGEAVVSMALRSVA